MFKHADDNWQPYIALGSLADIVDTCDMNGAPACEVGGDDWYLNDPNDEIERQTYADLDGHSTDSIIVGLTCRPNTDNLCGAGFSIPHVEVQIYSAFITLADPSPPTLGTPAGAGWAATDWVQGTLPLAASSTDNTGISATRVYADGSLIATLQRACHYDRPRPCDDEGVGAVGVPTASLADGLHQIDVAAVDAAGNEARVGRPQALMVDNQAPAAPVGLRSPAPTSTTNDFSASWSLPADAGSPIVAARYQLCQGGACGSVQTAPSLTGLSGLTLPAAGGARLRVWLVDRLGHANGEAAATLVLRYTPVPPAAALPPAAPLPLTPVPAPTPPAPPVPAPKASAALKLSTVRRTGRRVTVTGRLSRKASGRLTVRYAVRVARRLRTVSHRATIRSGSFRLTFTLSKTTARAHTGTITVSYAGDADTKSATARSTLRLRTR